MTLTSAYITQSHTLHGFPFEGANLSKAVPGSYAPKELSGQTQERGIILLLNACSSPRLSASEEAG